MISTTAFPQNTPGKKTIARALRRMLAKLYRPDLRPLLASPVDHDRSGGAPISCPSSSADLATHEFAEIGPGGRSTFRDVPVRITAAGTTDTARLTGPCKQHRCAQWDGFCRLGAAAAHAAFEFADTQADPDCPISASCRWRLENGPTACLVCPWVHRTDPQQLIALHEGVHS